MKNILIKVSGDLNENPKVLDFIKKKAERNYVVVICGGGTKISLAFSRAGYAISFDEKGRRVASSLEERIIMRKVLETEEKKLQDKLVGKGVFVKAPILYAGSVLCPINGDDLMKAYYLGFDEIYVYTKKDRVKKKKLAFRDYPKVKIKAV